MVNQYTQFDFGDTDQPRTQFVRHERIITDRGSQYSVSIGRVTDRAGVQKFIATVKAKKQYAKATHNSWAVRVARNGVIYETKRDDGEVGAGMVILRVLQKRNVSNVAVCVTRWFGGIKLHGDRFKHVQDATEYAVDQM